MMDFIKRQLVKRKQIIKYIISGGTATGVSLGFLFVLTDWLGIWYLASTVISFFAGFLTSFFLQKFWTFNDNGRDLIKQQLAIFLLITLVNLLGNTFFMYVLVDIFKVWYMLAQVVITALIAFWNYNAFRLFVFKPVEAING
jgi:putative flippase GtrA